MKNVLLLLSLLCLLVLPVASAERVCSVHDGDTFRTCAGQSIRLAGIDAPELAQPMGNESQKALSRMVLNQDVSLSCNGTSYLRQVCDADLANGTSINDQMVRQGWAFDSPKYSHGKYAFSQESARIRNMGIWALPGGGVRPWDFRHRLRN